MSEDNGNGNGHRHIKLVQPLTPDEENKRKCVLKLRELLAQAEQGHYVSLCVIAVRNSNNYNFQIVGPEMPFVGALRVLEKILTDAISTKLNRS